MSETGLLRRIEERLTQLHLSAEAASKRAKLSRDFIRNLRSEKSISPRVESLRRLAIALECSLAFLLEIDAPARLMTPEEEHVLHIYRQLPDRDRQLLTTIFEMFLQRRTAERGAVEPRRAKGGRK